MFKSPYILLILLFFITLGYSQETNTAIAAEIKTQTLGEFMRVEAAVTNKTEIITSIKYVLYVFKEDQSENVTRTEQSDRIVLQANENKSIAVSNFNSNEKDKVTLMLLVYDDKDKLIGRDRKVVLNDDEVKKDASDQFEPTQTEDDIYSGLLRGIVTEDTKTKPGRDFYIEFSSIYRLQQINGVEVVKVYERFSFGRNTIMEVQVGNTVVHRFFTQPRREFLQDQAKMAIVNVSRYFANLERNQNFIRQY